MPTNPTKQLLVINDRLTPKELYWHKWWFPAWSAVFSFPGHYSLGSLPSRSLHLFCYFFLICTLISTFSSFLSNCVLNLFYFFTYNHFLVVLCMTDTQNLYLQPQILSRSQVHIPKCLFNICIWMSVGMSSLTCPKPSLQFMTHSLAQICSLLYTHTFSI